MGMLVTLHLISVNVYTSISAPPERGFSYIELWMIGMQLPICVALVEYSIILGLKKFWKNSNEDDDYSKLLNNSKIFSIRQTNDKELKTKLNHYPIKNIDKIFLVLSIVYFIIFSLCYWILL